MASRPLVLPDPFSGEGSWDSWIVHFEDVAAVNNWGDAQKLLWLRVRLTGRARTAYQGLSAGAKESYEESKKALKERFEPTSKQELYRAELQTRRKSKTEGWADYAEALKRLTDKAFPDLQAAAKEQLGLMQYLDQLHTPQVAFSVKQKRPKTLDEAVAATLEMESYLISSSRREVAQVDVAKLPGTGPDEELSVAATGSGSQHGELLSTMNRLLERVERLEARLERDESGGHRRQQTAFRSSDTQHPSTTSSNSRDGRRQPVTCRRCGQEGHFSYGCASSRRPRQGN